MLKRNKLIAVATQKFVSDVAHDAMQFCRLRQRGSTRSKGQKVLTLTDIY